MFKGITTTSIYPRKKMSIIVTDELHIPDQGINLKVFNPEDGVTDPALLAQRGIIKNEEGTIVCKSFGYTPEVLVNDFENLNQLISPIVTQDTRFFKSYEGTLLRLWNYKGRWFFSTHRKVNAENSRWGHPATYKELFLRALKHSLIASTDGNGQSSVEGNVDIEQDFIGRLNPNLIYVIMLRSFIENRKVCMTGTEPSLFLIGTFDRNNNFAFIYADNNNNILPPVEEINTINTPEDLINHVASIHPMEYQGIVLINPDGTSGKVLSPAYADLDKVRGNEPNVLYRYVQLRWKPEELKRFVELYPEHQEKFTRWETVMSHVVHNIMRKYIERNINDHIAILPPEQYPVLKQANDFYYQVLRPNNQRLTVEHIWTILGSWSERNVNDLYKRYCDRERKLGNGNRIPDELRANILRNINRSTQR